MQETNHLIAAFQQKLHSNKTSVSETEVPCGRNRSRLELREKPSYANINMTTSATPAASMR